MDRAKTTSVLISIALAGCASAPQVVVDPKSITSEAVYQKDMDECHRIAKSYDLSDTKTKNALLGAAGGGLAVAGVATAVAGAIFPAGVALHRSRSHSRWPGWWWVDEVWRDISSGEDPG